MSLRLRLSLAFVFVVLAPMVIAAVLVARGVPESSDKLASSRAEAAVTGAAQLLTEQCGEAATIAESAAWQSAATSPRAAVRDAARAHRAYVAVLAPGGTPVASAGRLPPAAAASISSGSPAALGSCGQGAGASPYVVAAQVPVRAASGSARGIVVAALPINTALLERLRAVAGGEVSLVSAGQVVASTLPGDAATADAAAAPRILAAGHPLKVGGHMVDAVAAGGGRSVTVVVRGPTLADQIGLAQELAAVVVAAVVLAVAIGWLLARMSTRPLAELADAAARVAGGDLDTRIPVTSRDEVGQLSVAFNEMTDHLRTYIEALRRSSDELRRNVARLGDTLSSTHDLDRILTVIHETAMASVRASGGVLLMRTGGRGDLYAKITRGVEELPTGARVRVGEGVLGMVASTGDAVRGRVGPDGHLLGAGDRPDGARSVLAVPLKRSGRVLGVLGLFDRLDASEFDADDLETIRTFTAQATVAIDNVLLHEEAQRLSITDGLTGLWNYRYFTMNFSKEIERAARFHRRLSLLLVDLDKFKAVNDAYGHQRGDSVLIELATRVSSEIREVDTFARYGGEEFVLVLPENDATGAVRVAERLCDVIRHRPFGQEGEPPLHITVSVGVAVFPDHGRTAADLVRAADAALYAAKEAGRDSWHIAQGVEITTGPGE